MKKTMRIGTFETNSSSVHSIVLCTQGEFESLQRGESWLIRDGEEGYIVPPDNQLEKEYRLGWALFKTLDDFWDFAGERGYDGRMYAERDGFVVFGYYGNR